MKDPNDLAEVTRYMIGVCHMQVCVPEGWDAERIEAFANDRNPSGVTPWKVTTVEGWDERVPCEERECFVHIILVC